jgi:hypothetical protein
MRLRLAALGLAVAAITFFGISGFNIPYETLTRLSDLIEGRG